MMVFKIKTGEESTYNLFQNKSNNEILVDHLIQYDNQIKIGTPVFLLFGGDGTPWENGLAGICKISSSPIDLGYEIAKNGKYFKLKLEIIIRLKKHLTKMDFSKYPETFDTGIGPSTKGERNQALGIIEDDKAIAALCRAIIDQEPDLCNSIKDVFGDKIFNIARNDTIVYISPEEKKASNSTSSTDYPIQTIYYGVPGSGKSHEIDEQTKCLSDEQKMRVVFHPEYTNADFVGQILPCLNEDEGKVDYKFKPGPFTKILRRAYLNPSKKYFLIIEEINRGNAAAIFGDLFQLLDRIPKSIDKEKIGGNFYDEGWSSYFVSNDSINAYIREYADSSQYSDVEKCVVIPEENKNKDKISEKYSTVKIGDLIFTANTGIRLPPNLSILATMNTSDQNVFTLDNAFQRRWDMVLVKNEFKPESENQKTAKIAGSNVAWESFHKKINEEISKVSIENNLSSMVDKRLGCWFVKAVKDENGGFEIKKEDFENKILKYLWDDAFKFNREVFESVENFEELLGKVDMKAENFGVFRNLKFDENKKDSSNETGENEQN